MRRTRDQRSQVGHHLAAVAHAEREGIGAREEGFKFGARARVEQDRLRPASAAAKHVAIRKTATGSEALEIPEADAPFEDVAHVHVKCGKAGTVKGSRHFDLAIHALFTQDGDLRPRTRRDAFCTQGRGDVVYEIKRQHWRQARIGQSGQRIELL